MWHFRVDLTYCFAPENPLENYALVIYFITMRYFSPLRGSLLIIECARFSFLTGVLAVLRHNAGIAFPWQLYAVPNALFLIMALFLWLDASKYPAYLLLYISGKSLCLFSGISSWIAFSRNMEATAFFNMRISSPAAILAIILAVDLISIVIALIISSKKNIKTAAALSESESNTKIPESDSNETESQGGA